MSSDGIEKGKESHPASRVDCDDRHRRPRILGFQNPHSGNRERRARCVQSGGGVLHNGIRKNK
eukprot:2068050-Amphidinium_carterae.5